MAEYFGNNVNGDASNAGNAGYQLGNNPGADVFTCPGTGDMSVLALEARIQATKFRLAIYTSAKAFVMQGSVDITMSDPGTPGWYGHTSFVDYAGAPISSPKLTGSAAYIFVLWFKSDSNPTTYRRTEGLSTGMLYVGGESQFYNPWTGVGTQNATLCIRCQVEAAAGGGVGGTDIYLRPGHATPEDIILRDPTESDSTTKALDGVIAASSTLSASLSLTVPLDGAIAATSVLSASLSLTVPLAGAVSATSTLTAELTVVPAGVNLDGVIAATSALSGSLSLSKPLDGAIAGTGALTASLSLSKPLAGAIDAASTLNAALSLTVPLSGLLPAASTLSADLSLTKPLAGTTAATSALVASLSLSKPLDGAVSGTSALTGSLSLTVPLDGLLPGVSTLTGELTVVGFGVNLDGVISATSTLTATLTVEMTVYGYARLVTPAQPYLPLLSLARAHHDLPATAEAAKTIYTGADTALHLTCPPIGGHSWS